VLPESETKTVMLWSTTEINNECHDQETNDSKDLDTGKNELSLTINGHGEDVQADNENDNDRNPCCDIDVLCTLPISNDDRSSGYFSAESDCGSIPVLE
jgi:hypothetical protein